MNDGAAPVTTRVDLHTHSCCSDGTLSPTELVELAATRSVSLLALTDHDTLAGLSAAQAACDQHGIRFIAGIELSCGWQELEVHVLGLAIDPADEALERLCAGQQQRRRTRIEAMAARLTAQGLPGRLLADSALRAPSPTRTHLAQALHAQGYAASPQQAFERYLAAGQPGHVPVPWPTLSEVVEHIRAASGLAVLAHPHRYRVSRARLAALVAEFKSRGGFGIEISVAGMSPAEFAEAARLARRFDLAGSIGSDFHQPGLPWRPLGRFDKLPDAITPITARLVQAQDAARCGGGSPGDAADR